MKIRTAVFCAATAAFIASTGLAYAAYTGQFNIVQWAGVTLGAPSAAGTPATGNILTFQGNASGVPLPVSGSILQANQTPIFSLTSATTQLLVNASGSTKVYVTAFDCSIQAGSSATNGDCQLVQGTGSTCAGSTSALSPQFVWTPSAGITRGSGLGPIYISGAGNSVCIKTTLASSTVVTVGSIAAIQQ